MERRASSPVQVPCGGGGSRFWRLKVGTNNRGAPPFAVFEGWDFQSWIRRTFPPSANGCCFVEMPISLPPTLSSARGGNPVVEDHPWRDTLLHKTWVTRHRC